MAAAADLWTAVKADYDPDGLITLTNIRDRSVTAIDDANGTAAAQAVIDLWPIFAQAEYDPTDNADLQVAEMGVIAMLWRRGGASSVIEQVKWDEVFGSSGLLLKLRDTRARARIVPQSNSGVSQAPERDAGGHNVRGWSDRESLPVGVLSNRISATSD